jgi:hypothetical protein
VPTFSREREEVAAKEIQPAEQRRPVEQEWPSGPLTAEARQWLREQIDQKARERARSALPGHRQLDRELEKRGAA